MALLSMRLLGNPEITFGQRPLSFPTRKALALLIYLVIEKGMHSRESLMALLWPESSSKNAAVTLRGTLSRLRRALQPAGEVLLTETGKVGFDFSRTIDLDLAWLAAAALPEVPPDDLGTILNLDRGEFLAGCPRFRYLGSDSTRSDPSPGGNPLRSPDSAPIIPSRNYPRRGKRGALGRARPAE